MKSLSPREKKRTRAFNAMTTTGQQLAKVIDEKVAREAAETIMTSYTIGARLLAAREDTISFGISYVEQVAEYLPAGGAQALYSLIRFAKAFSHEYVKSHSLRLMASGGTLKVGHWLALTDVDDQEDREMLLEATLSESWSVEELADHIRAHCEVLRKR